MALHLKRRIEKTVTEEMDRKVRATVEGILADVGKRGDAGHVAEMEQELRALAGEDVG